MSYSIYHYYYYYSMVSANAWLQLTHLISTTESGCEMGVHPWKLVQPNKTLCSIICMWIKYETDCVGWESPSGNEAHGFQPRDGWQIRSRWLNSCIKPYLKPALPSASGAYILSCLIPLGWFSVLCSSRRSAFQYTLFEEPLSCWGQRQVRMGCLVQEPKGGRGSEPGLLEIPWRNGCLT